MPRSARHHVALNAVLIALALSVPATAQTWQVTPVPSPQPPQGTPYTTFVVPTPPPAQEYVARAVVAVPTTFSWQTAHFTQQVDLYPPAQSRIIAKMSDKYLVEFCALVRSGTSTVTIEDRPAATGGAITPGELRRFDADLRNLMETAQQIRVKWTGYSGQTEIMNLSGWPVPDFNQVRNGRYRITNAYQVKSTSFGGVQWWLDLPCSSKYLFLTINWHNGIPAPDVLFRSMELLLPAGFSWVPVIAEDTSCNQQNGNNYLVKPFAADGVTPVYHLLAKRFERPFRVIIFKTADGPPPVRYDRGLGFHDWATANAFLPHGLKVPSLAHITNLQTLVTGAYNGNRTWLQSLIDDPDYGTQTPHSFFLPAMGGRYGGYTGGTGIEWNYGVRLVATRRPEALMTYYIRQLRWRSRQPGCIYADIVNGQPANLGFACRPENNFVNGEAPWELFDRRFLPTGNNGLNARDLPWNFKGHPRPASPQPPSYEATLQNGSPNGWDTIDCQHYIRALSDNFALAWLDADPLAILYITMDAELGRTAYRPEPAAYPNLDPALGAGLGCKYGRGQGWVAHCVNASAALNWNRPRFQGLKNWMTFYLSQLASGQMPSGLTTCTTVGKGATMPPFGNNQVADYWVMQNFEQIINLNAIAGAREVFGEAAFTAALPPGRTLQQIVADHGAGIANIMWHTDNSGQVPQGTGPWKRFPLGPVNPPNVRYTTRSDFVPLNICVQDPQGETPYDNSNDPFYMGQALFICHRAGRDMLPQMRLYTQLPATATLAQIQNAVRGYGVHAGDPRSRSPLETFVGLLSLGP